MPRLYTDEDRYAARPQAVVVDATNEAVRDLVRGCLEELDGNFSEVVFGQLEELLTEEKICGVEQLILASGHRFAWSSALSVRDRPDIYESDSGADEPDFSFEHPDAPVFDPQDGGRQQRGSGDNVSRTKSNVTGRALYVRTSEKVLELMKGGVPPNTVAIIDDSGGTLTAPILEQFAGVICAGGTIRSHLGILTREYGIPCLMNARISGIRNGDVVELETSAPARTAESYAEGREMPAKVWRIPND